LLILLRAALLTETPEPSPLKKTTAYLMVAAVCVLTSTLLFGFLAALFYLLGPQFDRGGYLEGDSADDVRRVFMRMLAAMILATVAFCKRRSKNPSVKRPICSVAPA
jgi:hypothetical protein